MIRKIFVYFLAFNGFIYANGQDSTSKGHLALTGSVDAYYRYNFHNAKDSSLTNNYTSFTNSQNSFELGMASLMMTVHWPLSNRLMSPTLRLIR